MPRNDLAEAGATAPATASPPLGYRAIVSRYLAKVATIGVPVVLALAFLLPQVVTSPFRLQIFTIAFLNAAVVAPLVLSLGYAGMLNLSQGTFYGLGAYTTAILVTDHDWSFEAAIVAAALVAGIGDLTLSVGSVELGGIAWGSLGILLGYPIVSALAKSTANRRT